MQFKKYKTNNYIDANMEAMIYCPVPPPKVSYSKKEIIKDGVDFADDCVYGVSSIFAVSFIKRFIEMTRDMKYDDLKLSVEELYNKYCIDVDGEKK